VANHLFRLPWPNNWAKSWVSYARKYSASLTQAALRFIHNHVSHPCHHMVEVVAGVKPVTRVVSQELDNRVPTLVLYGSQSTIFLPSIVENPWAQVPHVIWILTEPSILEHRTNNYSLNLIGAFIDLGLLHSLNTSLMAICGYIPAHQESGWHYCKPFLPSPLQISCSLSNGNRQSFHKLILRTCR
jgi:hypothetical protein